MAILLASPPGPNAGMFRLIKNSLTKVDPKYKCGDNRRREVATHGVGVKTVIRLGGDEAIRGRSPIGKASWCLWAPTRPLPGLTRTLTFKGSGPSEAIGNKPNSTVMKVLKFPDVLLRFMRPHVVHMIILGFTGVMTRTWMENCHLVKIPKWILLFKGMALFIGLLCADSFTSGINQIYDIEIDKINKPDLPLASGEISLRFAWMLTISYMIIGIAISMLLQSGALLGHVLFHLIMGSLYSVPPFNLKRSTIGAIITCALGRGVVFVLGSSGAARTILGLPFRLSPPVVFMAIFTTLFIIVCAALKDIEDLEGDKKSNIPTLAAIYGPRKIALFGFGFILLNYIGAIITAILMPQVFRQNIMIPSHVILASFVVFQALKWDKANYAKEASQSIFQSIIKLFIIEFILFPFI